VTEKRKITHHIEKAKYGAHRFLSFTINKIEKYSPTQLSYKNNKFCFYKTAILYKQNLFCNKIVMLHHTSVLH
jgi:hypothetical protein